MYFMRCVPLSFHQITHLNTVFESFKNTKQQLWTALRNWKPYSGRHIKEVSEKQFSNFYVFFSKHLDLLQKTSSTVSLVSMNSMKKKLWINVRSKVVDIDKNESESAKSFDSYPYSVKFSVRGTGSFKFTENTESGFVLGFFLRWLHSRS